VLVCDFGERIQAGSQPASENNSFHAAIIPELSKSGFGFGGGESLAESPHTLSIVQLGTLLTVMAGPVTVLMRHTFLLTQTL
jgi:hypothetical protein